MPYSNLEVLAYEPSPIGMICLRRRELLSEPGTVVTEITVDHEFLMSSLTTDSERALARLGLSMHEGSGLDVLVGGLGLGYTAREVLRSPRVERVEVVELLPPVIDWLERGLVPLSDELRADARFAVRQGDVFARLAAPPERRHDLILIDVDHSPEERLADDDGSFYGEAGLEAARGHLAPGGVLGVWSYAESTPFEATLRRVFGEVSVEQITFMNRALGEEETNWLLFARG
jgi:spermidine synthase